MSLPQLEQYRITKPSPPPMEWVSSLGCWCVYDAPTVTTILKSPDFSVVNYAEVYRSLEQTVGMNCSALIRALSHIPLANEGKVHIDLRRDLARLLHTELGHAKQHLATLIPATLANVCQSESRVDLVQEIVRPSADALFACVFGVELPACAASGISVSQIFDRSLSLNRRKAINTQADAIRQAFGAATGRLKTSPDYALALTAIGHDSIVATLGRSLLRVLEDGAGKRLSDLAFPSLLPETGVPYVERIASKDCCLNGSDLHVGDRVRLYLEPPHNAKTAVSEVRPFFGRGRHSCIGEEISIWLWRAITAELSRLPLKFVVECAHRRERDYVFVYYSNVTVYFHA
jgi:cytochrome P450